MLIVSSSPHVRARGGIPLIMWTVVLTLIPAGAVGTIVFGYYVLVVAAASVATAVATEALIQAARKKPITVSDGSAFITGLLLAYVLPPNVPLYVAVVGSFVAIGVAKQTFGGLGCNIWNPALVGRAFVQVAYPAHVSMAEWPILKAGHFLTSNIHVDAVSRATPLVAGAAAKQYGYLQLFLGRHPGCMGETSAAALIAGGLVLITLRHVDWRVPLCYIGTVAFLSWVLPARGQGWLSGDPLYSVLSGGLMIGAFFMATDMVTSPLTAKGMAIFGMGAGIMTVVIRLYGGYPEGVCYAILLMNTATPLIDRYCRPRVFGGSQR